MSEPVHRIWWKEPMVWLVAGLPIAAVIASFATYFIAADKPDALVNAGYQKEGLAPLKDNSKEQRANALSIKADMTIGAGEIRITLSGKLDAWPTSLELLLLHPANAEKDLRVSLNNQGNGLYSAPEPEHLHGKRHWVLEPKKQDWQLSGELTLP